MRIDLPGSVNDLTDWRSTPLTNIFVGQIEIIYQSVLVVNKLATLVLITSMNTWEIINDESGSFLLYMAVCLQCCHQFNIHKHDNLSAGDDNAYI